MYRTFITAAALLLTSAMPALAAGMDMPMGTKPAAMATNADFRFSLAGAPTSASPGKSVVSIKLDRGGKPVTGAIVIQSRADMSPIGMASMSAPIKTLGEQPPGTYRFEVDNGSVWKKPDNWSLSFSAKVQGVAQTVTGSVIVKLVP
ncbi:MAG: FixH family protein [Proteobacteria bacterium]|nr:FixH family protein [Pseudomonadota bacterium]